MLRLTLEAIGLGRIRTGRVRAHAKGPIRKLALLEPLGALAWRLVRDFRAARKDESQTDPHARQSVAPTLGEVTYALH